MAGERLSLRQFVTHSPLPGDTALIPVCSMCGLIREKTGPSQKQERWVTKRTYLKTHGVSLADGHLTHTYCPGCFTDFMERVKPLTRSIGLTG